MRPLSTLLLVLTLLAARSASAAGVGDPAPGFTLLDTQGVSRSLSDYQGKVVVLFFVGYG